VHVKKARKKHGFSTKTLLTGVFFGLKCALYPIFRLATVFYLPVGWKNAHLQHEVFTPPS
jgi:hypothetical protein